MKCVLHVNAARQPFIDLKFVLICASIKALIRQALGNSLSMHDHTCQCQWSYKAAPSEK